MVVAPHAFYTAIGPFDVYNDHYLRDVATFNAALGVGLACRWCGRSWRVPVLAITTLQFALHSVNHLIDIDTRAPALDRATSTSSRSPLANAGAGVAAAHCHRLRTRPVMSHPTDQGDPPMTRIADTPGPAALRCGARDLTHRAAQARAATIGPPLDVYAHAPRLLVGYGMFEKAHRRPASRRRAAEGRSPS